MQLAQCDLQRPHQLEVSPATCNALEGHEFFSRLGAAHFRRTQEKTSIAKYSRKRACLIEKMRPRDERLSLFGAESRLGTGEREGQWNETYALANIQSIDGGRGRGRCFARPDLFYSCAALEGRHGDRL